MKTIVKMLSTFFYLGYFPRIPGTVGSLGGLAFYFIARYNAVIYISSMILFIIAAFLVVKKAEAFFCKKDARQIVIDEAIGMMVALFMLPSRWPLIVIAFLLFRIFDILKPFPIRRIEKSEGPWGVVLDDIVAGIYANLSVWAVYIFALNRTL